VFSDDFLNQIEKIQRIVVGHRLVRSSESSGGMDCSYLGRDPSQRETTAFEHLVCDLVSKLHVSDDAHHFKPELNNLDL
jgi:hypothetical protein